MASSDLLCAALSAAIKRSVEFKDNGVDAMCIHELTIPGGKVSRESPQEPPKKVELPPGAVTRRIFVRTLVGYTLEVEAFGAMTILQLKQQIRYTSYHHFPHRDTNPQDYLDRDSFPEIPRLIFAGHKLEDHCTLDMYNIQLESTLHIVLRLRGGGGPVPSLCVSKDTLAPEFDYDFTKEKDRGKIFTRGGEPYVRPCGWQRYALSVKGKFEDDTWLGCVGPRKQSSEGEWAVSYHGTSKHNAESIAEKGYLLSKGKRFKFGYGVYSTPDIRIAERYAAEFKHEKKTYLVVIQNRVNPESLEKIENADSVGTGVYWLNSRELDVRPYGLLIKEKKTSWLSILRR